MDKLYKHRAQNELYKYLKESNDIIVTKSDISKKIKNLSSAEIYKGLSDLNKDESISRYKQGQYINKLKFKSWDEESSNFVKFKVLKSNLGAEYKNIEILEDVSHFANKKGITQQGTYVDFMFYYKDSKQSAKAKELLELFCSLIKTRPDKVKIISNSIFDVRDLIQEIFVLSENPTIKNITKVMNDEYGHIFKLTEADEDTHPDDSTLLGNFLYGKVERWKYHELLNQGANKIKITLTNFSTN